MKPGGDAVIGPTPASSGGAVIGPTPATSGGAVIGPTPATGGGAVIGPTPATSGGAVIGPTPATGGGAVIGPTPATGGGAVIGPAASTVSPMSWTEFDARFTMRGHQLSEVKSLIDSAQYQGAYTQARLFGYSPDSIANFVNTNYGTKWSGADLAKSYEATAQATLSAQGYAFDRAGFSNGAFNGAPFRRQDFLDTVPPGGAPIGLAGIPLVKLTDYVSSSNPTWAAQARAQVAADQERAAGSRAVIGPN